METPMSFREAFEAVCAVAQQRGDSAALSVNAWHHHHKSGPDVRSVVMNVYSRVDDRTYYGLTLRSVVAQYQATLDGALEELDPIGTVERPRLEGGDDGARS